MHPPPPFVPNALKSFGSCAVYIYLFTFWGMNVLKPFKAFLGSNVLKCQKEHSVGNHSVGADYQTFSQTALTSGNCTALDGLYVTAGHMLVHPSRWCKQVTLFWFFGYFTTNPLLLSKLLHWTPQVICSVFCMPGIPKLFKAVGSSGVLRTLSVCHHQMTVMGVVVPNPVSIHLWYRSSSYRQKSKAFWTLQNLLL